jgi:replicative DNA helicase
MDRKTPPHDLDAEQSVLGGILIDPPAISLVLEVINSHHFYKREHQVIFESMLSLYDKRQPVDIVTLGAQLTEDGKLKEIGGTKYLSQLIEAVPSSANIQHYARIIKSQFVKRSLVTMSSRMVEKAYENTGEVKDLLNEAEREIFSLSQSYLHQDFVSLKDIVGDTFDRLEEFKKNGEGIRGIPTGYKDVDAKLAGLHDSNLIILAARPGIGKTTFAVNIAINAALKQKTPVGIFSLEMSKEELVDRLLVGQADIDAWKLKTGRLSDDEISALTQAMGELSEAPIYIDDTPGASILELRSKARKLKIEKGLKLLVVDYLQLIDPGKRIENRSQEVSYISQNLKNLARELKIPVIALSQLSRAIEHRGEKRPQLADLRESGAIEQDADIVMFLYYENESDDLLDQGKKMIKLFVAKHRNGSTGEIDLMFRGDRVKFYGVDHGSGF